MKIYFCDICNESIPLKDINTDRITIEGGRIFCPKCAPKSVRPRPATARSVSLLMAIVAFTGLAVLGFNWKIADEVGRRVDDLARRVGDAEVSSKAAGEAQGSAAARLEQVLKRVDELAADVRDARLQLAGSVADLDRRELGSTERLGTDLARGLSEVRGEMKAQHAALAGDQKALEVDCEGLKVGLQSYEERLKLLADIVSSRPAAAEPKPEPEVPPTDVPRALNREELEEHEINQILVQLQDPDSARRYAAIIELGRYSGPKVAKALEGMLQDADELIRVAAVDHLKKVGLPSSVPHLISALRDRDPFVRGAAKRALDQIAGAAVDFQPEASAAEREARVKEWERWWEANREKLLTT